MPRDRDRYLAEKTLRRGRSRRPRAHYPRPGQVSAPADLEESHEELEFEEASSLPPASALDDEMDTEPSEGPIVALRGNARGVLSEDLRELAQVIDALEVVETEIRQIKERVLSLGNAVVSSEVNGHRGG